MSSTRPSHGAPEAVIERLCRATNDHDVDAIVGCFASDYRNETPVHPDRGFTGSAQVRKNWAGILGAIRDLHTIVLRSAVDGDTVWTEWEHRGTRTDGSLHLMRGAIIFGVADGLIASARFYLEPVQDGGGFVDAAVRNQVTAAPPNPPSGERS